jgi:hypothetical protein
MRGGFFPAVSRTDWAQGSLNQAGNPRISGQWGCVTDDAKSAAAIVALSCVSEVKLVNVLPVTMRTPALFQAGARIAALPELRSHPVHSRASRLPC